MDTVVNLTVSTIEKLPIPDSNRVEYKDKKLPELRLRITSTGAKSFSVYKRVNGGKPVRVTLGKFPALTPTKAKILAQQCLAELVVGSNPNHVRKRNDLENITLKQAYSQYINSKPLKPNTLKDYKSLINCQLSIIADKKLTDITREDVEKVHKRAESESRADYAMRVLRAVINFINNESASICGEPLITDNPVKVLSHKKQWNHVGRRNTHVRSSELRDFFDALTYVRQNETITGQSVCDALLFALITGLRKNEVLNLKWSDINYRGKFFTIHETKSGEPLELPITPAIEDILDTRKKAYRTDYVFSAINQYGQVRTPRKVVQKIKELSGTSCDFHDLRRTFATTAEHLDIGNYKLKRLMNHATNRNDVTAGYIVMTAETLRGAAESIQKKLLDIAN